MPGRGAVYFQPITLINQLNSFHSHVNKGGKKINKCKELKSKLNFTTSQIITDMITKHHPLGLEPRPLAT
jgi:hypothetical protein